MIGTHGKTLAKIAGVILLYIMEQSKPQLHYRIDPLIIRNYQLAASRSAIKYLLNNVKNYEIVLRKILTWKI